MPRTIRFHLDEHVAPAIAEALRRRGVDVTTTREVGLTHAPDEDHVTFGIANSRVIFTQDQDFLRIHSAGLPHAGITFCQQRARSIGQIVDNLVLIWEVLDASEMANRVEFL